MRSETPAAGDNVLREFPGLTPEQAVVSGDSMNTSALIQVRNWITEHGAESPDVVDEWTTAHDQRQREPTRSEPADFGEGDQTASKI